jgi:hypothetical protein
MAKQSYSERIRHPSGALNPAREKEQSRSRLIWLLLGLAAFGYFAYRMGWLNKMAATGAKVVSAVRPVANPQGWV